MNKLKDEEGSIVGELEIYVQQLLKSKSRVSGGPSEIIVPPVACRRGQLSIPGMSSQQSLKATSVSFPIHQF
jgi:hypothetical protein